MVIHGTMISPFKSGYPMLKIVPPFLSTKTFKPNGVPLFSPSTYMVALMHDPIEEDQEGVSHTNIPLIYPSLK